MVASDTKYHLNCLTSLCRREKKTNRTHCDEKESKEGTVAFSFRHIISTKFEISTLMNPATVLVINTSLFQMFLSNFSLTSNSLQEFRNSLTFTLRIRTYIFKVKINFKKLNQFFNYMSHYSKNGRF